MTLNDKYIFDRAPNRAYWEVTRACDLSCRHCRAEADPFACPGELTHEQGKALIDRLAAFGEPLPHVVLTGGDPLKRNDLFQLIAYAQSRGLGVSVSPSGTPLLTPDTVAKIKQAGVDAISLSIDGSTAQIHDDLRGVPGCYARTMEAARAATAVGLMYQVNTLVSEETVDDLPAIAQLVSSLRAARWSLFFLVTVGRGTVLRPISSERCETLFRWLASLSLEGTPVITTTEAPHFRRIQAEHRRSMGSSGNVTPQHPARPGHSHGGAGIRDGNGIVFISSVGDIHPSGFLPLMAGNVKTDDLVAVYRESELFTSLRRPDDFGPRCGICEYRMICGGSRARAFADSGNPLADDPLCVYQPRRAHAVA